MCGALRTCGGFCTGTVYSKRQLEEGEGFSFLINFNISLSATPAFKQPALQLDTRFLPQNLAGPVS